MKPTSAQIKKYNTFAQAANAMAHVFSDAQTTLSGHRKLVVLLRHVQLRAVAMGWEEQFNFQFTKLLSKILKLRKGVPAADRVAKFCSVFVGTILKEEAEAAHSARGADSDSDASVAAELVDSVLRHLLRGVESKSKDVRYRTAQLLAYLVNYITEIDEQLFRALRFSLSRRMADKEAVVRIQAVVATSRFQYLDGLGPQETGQATAALLAALRADESPEVRRAAILNVAKTPAAVPELLQRARDSNAINRRLVFSRTLRELSPQALDAGLKDSLLQWGLNDRDASVRSAAVHMLTKVWLPAANDDIVTLLENLRVVGSDVAPQMMAVLFDARRDVLDTEIPWEMWRELTVEKAFYLRAYFDYCTQHRLYDGLDKNIPELTKLAFLVQDYFKLRDAMLSGNSKLVETYAAHQEKLERLSRLLAAGGGEIREYHRRISKEKLFVAQLQKHTDEVDAEIAAKKQQIRTLTADSSRNPSKKDKNNETISGLKIDLKDCTTEAQEAAKSIEEYEASIEELEDHLRELERIQNHKSQERDRYVDSASELEEEYLPFGEQLGDLEFVIEQLLSIIRGCDFADVAGTRRLMPVITNALTYSNLNGSNISLCVQILRKASTDENYFSQLCTEIITDIRDSALDENDETFVSATNLFNEGSDDERSAESEVAGNEAETSSDGKRRKVAPTMPPDHLLVQCLTILQHYLEIAEDTRSNSYQLDTLIDTLIRPALTNTNNGVIRTLGYKTLGLFTLIDKGLAASNLKFFGISASKAHDEELKSVCMKIMFDILCTHGVGVLQMEGEEGVDPLSLTRLFGSLLKTHDMPKLQAVVGEGLCKLFLAELLVDFGKGDVVEDGAEDISQEDQLLEALIMAYFHPASAENEELRQVLAFCLPVYCFSHEKHQMKISAVSGDCFYRLFRTGSDVESLEHAPSPTNTLQQLIYWCDPNNVANISPENAASSASHLWQAIKMLQIVEQDTPKAVKKVVLQNLSKLSLTEHIGSELLRGLKNAVEDTKQMIGTSRDPDFALDASTERALEKFLANVEELLSKAESLPERPPRSRTPSMSQKEKTEIREEESGEGERSLGAVEGAAVAEKSAGEVSESKGNGDEGEGLAAELADIDNLLEAEADINYDVEV